MGELRMFIILFELMILERKKYGSITDLQYLLPMNSRQVIVLNCFNLLCKKLVSCKVVSKFSHQENVNYAFNKNDIVDRDSHCRHTKRSWSEMK